MIVNFVIHKSPIAPIAAPQVRQEIKQPKNFGNPRFWYILAVAIVIGMAYIVFPVSETRKKKKEKEIESIKTKTYKPPKDNCANCCMQYALRATQDGWYPCYSETCKGGRIWLKKGEVWKYGKTCLSETERYGKFTLKEANLYFDPEFYGNEKDCLIKEKEKIYNYPNLPECTLRGIYLMRPPGNVIDK